VVAKAMVMKGVAKKTPFSNVVTLAKIYTKKMIAINLYSLGYENSNGLAIIQDFTAH
jgi:hypothetical protein